MLQKSGTGDYLDEALNQIKNTSYTISAGTIYTRLSSIGHVSYIRFDDYYREHNQLEAAKSRIRQELEALEHIFGVENIIVLALMNDLSDIIISHGSYDEAEPIYRQKLALSKKVLGKEYLETLISINNLAELLRSQGKYNKAKPIH
jgi:hypothetical protein